MKHISAFSGFATSVSTVDLTVVQTVCGLWVSPGDTVSIGGPWSPSVADEIADCQPCLFGNAIKSELGSVARSIEGLTEEIRAQRRSEEPETTVPRRWFR